MENNNTITVPKRDADIWIEKLKSGSRTLSWDTLSLISKMSAHEAHKEKVAQKDLLEQLGKSIDISVCLVLNILSNVSEAVFESGKPNPNQDAVLDAEGLLDLLIKWARVKGQLKHSLYACVALANLAMSERGHTMVGQLGGFDAIRSFIERTGASNKLESPQPSIFKRLKPESLDSDFMTESSFEDASASSDSQVSENEDEGEEEAEGIEKDWQPISENVVQQPQPASSEVAIPSIQVNEKEAVGPNEENAVNEQQTSPTEESAVESKPSEAKDTSVVTESSEPKLDAVSIENGAPTKEIKENNKEEMEIAKENKDRMEIDDKQQINDQKSESESEEDTYSMEEEDSEEREEKGEGDEDDEFESLHILGGFTYRTLQMFVPLLRCKEPTVQLFGLRCLEGVVETSLARNQVLLWRDIALEGGVQPIRDMALNQTDAQVRQCAKRLLVKLDVYIPSENVSTQITASETQTGGKRKWWHLW